MPEQKKMPVLRERKKRRISNRKILIFLIIFFMILFIVLFFHSSISKISAIEVEGIRFVSEEQVLQAGEVVIGDPFFTVVPSKVAERVGLIAGIEKADVHKSFPGRLFIAVTEYAHVANEPAAGGGWMLVLANGTTLSMGSQNEWNPVIMDKPILRGWGNLAELKGKLAASLVEIRPEIVQDISEIKPNPSDVYEDKIVLYTRSGFEVTTTVGKMKDKLPYLPGVIGDMREMGYTEGRITMLEAITSEPFPTEESTENEEMQDAEKRDY